MSLILLTILLLILLPVSGVYVVAGGLGIFIKVLFVILLIALIANLWPATGGRGRWF